ncbi:glycosyltransferase family 2 protein [Desulfogranum japonicum]|uniref:glycosyltransferase family 2 protein n=1 Tax=Desulfogranum japonicum TaxID=231447 RepID=UPI000558D98D|nr:glycosyltransferase family 2 protein [Desulfogranum japonicum]
MNKLSLLLVLLIGGLSFMTWAIFNRPDQLPTWPSHIDGFSFNPMRMHNDPSLEQYPTIEEIEQDLALLEGSVYSVRTYSVLGTLGDIPKLASEHNLNVAVGVWIGTDMERNEAELKKLFSVYGESIRNIVRVVIGNESLLRNDVSVHTLIGYLDRMQKVINAPISTAEPWHVWLDHPELVEHVDYLAVHILPYWEGIEVNEAINFTKSRMQMLQEAYPNKPIVITEIGWPSRGSTRGQASASLANQATFLRKFLDVAQQENYTYYIMEAFDQVWKRELEGEVGTAWGVYDADRVAKFPHIEPVIRIPEWPTLAGLCTSLALVVAAFLFRDSKGLTYKGRGFLTVLTYAVVTATVWIVYDYTQRYLTTGTLIVGVLMILSALGIGVVLLAEAHEWAEALWLGSLRRMPKDTEKSEYQPKVSIHVPAYNEPPDMLIQTLDCLAALCYPDYEVLVIDNNTKDPNVWKPVEEHCKQLGERFKFFHVAPLEGFKAGALNFALKHTAEDAEVIAVIDSDYLVSPDWLKDLAPLYENPKVAIVQAPQDYHDGQESAFKAMIHAEYNGFFHIGMVTRNERNAIIQHGTMTMVRLQVMKDIQGWAEWCITEDAELGLRIFADGYEAIYVPKSYGQGLMPDTFLDFKKQRFRWAYGAMLIIRHHLAALLGLKKTSLTRGQRYHFLAGWLPWLADGVNMLFNLGALTWTTLMIVKPAYFSPPEALFSLMPLTFFAFKILKMFALYRWRIKAGYRQCLAAGLAGLALSHTIGRAMLAGFITKGIGFFRTPKMSSKNKLLQAMAACREELLFAIAFLLGGYALGMTQDLSLFDLRMWRLVLFVQTMPFLAAILVSLISAMPWLPAWLIGAMKPIDRATEPGKVPRQTGSGFVF